MPVLRHIYDSATKTYHDVEVTQEVYDFYRRNTWAIRRNDTRFYAHEIQFSSLIGGADDTFERFNEFSSTAFEPLCILCDETAAELLLDAFRQLPLDDQLLLQFLVLEGHTEREYGQKMMLAQQTIHNRKGSAVRKLKRLLNRLQEKPGAS